MALFKRKKVKNIKETSVIDTNDIFDRMSAEDDMNDIIADYGATLVDVVIKESKRIEAEVNALLNGSIIIVEEIRDEEGVIIQESESFEATTQKSVEDMIVSTMLDVKTVISDVVSWSDGDPDKAPNFNQYKETFKTE